MKKAIPLILTLLVFLVSVSFASSSEETATRAEFEEFSKLLEGRWIGDITLTSDSPDYGKKGDIMTGYSDIRIISDGNGLQINSYSGDNTGTILFYYDPIGEKIKGVSVSSNGGTNICTIFKKNSIWHWKSTGSTADGIKREVLRTLSISSDGITHIWSGTATVGGEKTNPHGVWRHVSK